VTDKDVGLNTSQHDEGKRYGTANGGEENEANAPETKHKSAHVRIARANLIEETTYRLTDLFTIVSARIELLGDKVPAACRDELEAIRNVLIRGVELNKRLVQAAQSCRRETQS